MPNTTRQELLRYWKQSDKDLDRFLGNLQKINELFEEANQQYEGRYDEFIATCTGFAVLVTKIQKEWRKLRHNKL